MSTTTAPATRRTAAWTLVLPVAAAVVLGVAVGYASPVVTVALLAAAVLAAMVLRLEWAVLVVVASAVFEDYLARVDPSAVKALGLLLVLAWVVRRCAGPIHDAPRSAVLGAAAAFAGAILVATIVHNNGADGLEVVLRYAGFLVVLVVIADVLRGGLSPVRLARTYVAACAVAAACGMLAFGVGADRRVGGPIGDPNDFAFFLLPAIALGLATRAAGRRRWPWDLATLAIVVAVLGTLSRGALLGLLAMGVLALVVGMVRLRTALGLGVVVGGVVLAVLAVAPGLVTTSLEQKGVVAGQNVSERLDLWAAAGQMTLEQPVVGLGPGAFSQHHDEYTSGLPEDVNHPLDVAHNTWLEISSELGLLGLLSFAAMLVLAFVAAWTTWRRRGDPLAAGTAAALFGCSVAATFVTEQYYLPLWLLSGLAVGVAAARGESA